MLHLSHTLGMKTTLATGNFVRQRQPTLTLALLVFAMLVGCENEKQLVRPTTSAPDSSGVASASEDSISNKIRFATFNVALNRKTAGALAAELATGNSPKTAQIAEIIQRIRPDVLLLNEFDFDSAGSGIKSFQDNFLAQSQRKQPPIRYEFVYSAPVNTGIDSGFDLNADGLTGTADDGFGYGEFPGQYGMVVLSRFPIALDQLRTFQNFLWKDLPEANWPVDRQSNKPYYSDEIQAVFRLSSKSHWDVPIRVGSETIHFLVSHPTPPVFDGEEDRNGCRNHDEIKFWADYVSGSADYHYDDAGVHGGLPIDAKFVIAGDQNADPVDGDSQLDSARQLTEHPTINHTVTPQSTGGIYYAEKQAEANRKQTGNPALDTGDFNDSNVGNMRIDYCLPSATLNLVGSGVFWPTPDQTGGDLVEASDHRLVWIDLDPMNWLLH